jgi:hypothetical protein
MLASNSTLRRHQNCANEPRAGIVPSSQCWRQSFGTIQNFNQLCMPKHLHKAENLNIFTRCDEEAYDLNNRHYSTDLLKLMFTA